MDLPAPRRNSRQISADNSDDYGPAVVQDARIVQREKARLVWVATRKATLYDREFDLCLLMIGMRHLTVGEMSGDRQRLDLYRLKPAMEVESDSP